MDSSVQRAANNMTVPNQTFNGARQGIQPAPQIGLKKRNLHTKDDESSRKRNAAKHSRLFDMIQNPSILISEFTQAHNVPTITPSTAIAEDDEFTEAEIISQSALGNAASYQLISELTQAHTVPTTTPSTTIAEADITSYSHPGIMVVFQLSTLATHQDSTAGNRASQTIDEAIIALQTRITANQYPVNSTVRTGLQSSTQDISEALTQDQEIEALGDQSCSKLPASGISP